MKESFKTAAREFPNDRPDRLTNNSATEMVLTSETFIWQPGYSYRIWNDQADGKNPANYMEN